MCLTGPPIGQWSGQTGLDNNVHYIDTGPNELRIRDNSEPRANVLEIYPSKSIHTVGPVTMDGKLTMNKNVEIRKLPGDNESGVLEVPMVRANQVAPIGPETLVKILSLTSDVIMPSPGSATSLSGPVEIAAGTATKFGNTLFVDKLEKTVGFSDFLTLKNKTKTEDDVIVATNKSPSVDTIQPTVATDVTLDCGINVEGDAVIIPINRVVTDGDQACQHCLH